MEDKTQKGYNSPKPSVGKTGSYNNHPGGTGKLGESSSEGQQIPFLPGKEKYSGRKGGGPTKSGAVGTTDTQDAFPFLPKGKKGK